MHHASHVGQVRSQEKDKSTTGVGGAGLGSALGAEGKTGQPDDAEHAAAA